MYKLHIACTKIYPRLVSVVLPSRRYTQIIAEMWGVSSLLWDIYGFNRPDQRFA